MLVLRTALEPATLIRMAQKVTMTLVSDLSGKELPEGEGETINFSYRGVEYNIDLTDDEAAKFDKVMDQYTSAGTRVSGRRSSGRRSSGSSGEDLTAVREWARQNGYEVSERGRVAKTILDAYHSRTN